jgi:hypothetical protein
MLLEYSIEKGLLVYPFSKDDPLFENIRSDHRFSALMADMKIKWESFDDLPA